MIIFITAHKHIAKVWIFQKVQEIFDLTLTIHFDIVMPVPEVIFQTLQNLTIYAFTYCRQTCFANAFLHSMNQTNHDFRTRLCTNMYYANNAVKFKRFNQFISQLPSTKECRYYPKRDNHPSLGKPIAACDLYQVFAKTWSPLTTLTRICYISLSADTFSPFPL